MKRVRLLPARFVMLVVTTFIVARSSFGNGGEEVPVPLELQAHLLAKVMSYDRNLATRAGSRVNIAVVGMPSEPTSMPVARQMRQMLDSLGDFELPHDVQILQFTNASDLADKCKSGSISLVYFATGFHKDVEAIRSSLEPLPILTVTAIPEEVEKGIVLGFDLVHGRPKLIFHRTQALKQKVDMPSDVLKLMRIVE